MRASPARKESDHSSKPFFGARDQDIFFSHSPEKTSFFSRRTGPAVAVQNRTLNTQHIVQTKSGKDAFGNECPTGVTLDSIKQLPAFNKKLYDEGIRTWLGIYANMKVSGPKAKYKSCISEVLKVEKNTCGKKGKLAEYKPCSPKKYCLSVGGTKDFPAPTNIFIDMHRSKRRFNHLEGSGKKSCEVTCLQRYGCGGKEIERFYVTRTFKTSTFKVGNKSVPITVGTITKVKAKK